jgi:hypothetical protein
VTAAQLYNGMLVLRDTFLAIGVLNLFFVSH